MLPWCVVLFTMLEFVPLAKLNQMLLDTCYLCANYDNLCFT